jgi:hypothetical protein
VDARLSRDATNYNGWPVPPAWRRPNVIARLGMPAMTGVSAVKSAGGGDLAAVTCERLRRYCYECGITRVMVSRAISLCCGVGSTDCPAYAEEGPPRGSNHPSTQRRGERALGRAGVHVGCPRGHCSPQLRARLGMESERPLPTQSGLPRRHTRHCKPLIGGRPDPESGPKHGFGCT